MLYHAKLSFKTDAEIRTFQDKHKLRQCMIIKVAVYFMEEKDIPNPKNRRKKGEGS